MPLVGGISGFYPRDPCGPRRAGRPAARFQSGVSIRATRAGRDIIVALNRHQTRQVSIRATRAGRDTMSSGSTFSLKVFLSARPVRAATQDVSDYPLAEDVSIRATRAGRDGHGAIRVLWGSGFYPRDPCGPRRELLAASAAIRMFLSARPVRAATISATMDRYYVLVSIRATRAGRDLERRQAAVRVAVSIRATRAGRDACARLPASASYGCFYPRDPCGPRRNGHFKRAERLEFLSARPVRAATSSRPRRCREARCFYPRDPCGPRHHNV